jgi:hypothetical protein
MRMPSDKEANAPVFAIDPTFGEMAVQIGEAAWSIPELSQREKVAHLHRRRCMHARYRTAA